MSTNYNDKRNFERVDIHGFIADIADGSFVFDGTLEDISIDGFRINNVPQKLQLKAKKYNVVVSGHQENFKIVVVPRWVKKNRDNGYQEVGFKILNPSWNWIGFVKEIIPEEETEDLWG